MHSVHSLTSTSLVFFTLVLQTTALPARYRCRIHVTRPTLGSDDHIPTAQVHTSCVETVSLPDLPLKDLRKIAVPPSYQFFVYGQPGHEPATSEVIYPPRLAEASGPRAARNPGADEAGEGGDWLQDHFNARFGQASTASIPSNTPDGAKDSSKARGLGWYPGFHRAFLAGQGYKAKSNDRHQPAKFPHVVEDVKLKGPKRPCHEATSKSAPTGPLALWHSVVPKRIQAAKESLSRHAPEWPAMLQEAFEAAKQKLDTTLLNTILWVCCAMLGFSILYDLWTGWALEELEDEEEEMDDVVEEGRVRLEGDEKRLVVELE